MEKLNDYLSQFRSIELIIMACILLFIFFIIIFLAMTIISRRKKKRREKIADSFIKHIEKTLFLIAFDEVTFKELKEQDDFSKQWKKKRYRDQFLKELIKLRRVYGGEFGKKLQEFYRASGLLKLSYEKIRSSKWYLKCEGIQELSEMGIKKAAPIIQEHTKSGNDTLKMVALIEVIHLKGIEGLNLLKDYEEPLNDWIQLNLLDSIKESGYTGEIPDFGYLLEAKNDSLIVFGMRLISFFHQTQHLDTIRELVNSPSRKIRLQAKITNERLSPE